MCCFFDCNHVTVGQIYGGEKQKRTLVISSEKVGQSDLVLRLHGISAYRGVLMHGQ